MQQLAERIVSIIADYHSDYIGADAFTFNSQYVLNWVNQFDEVDRQFILEELHHLLSKDIYISKSRAKELIRRRIETLATTYKFSTVRSFLENVAFLDLQPKDKSQTVLLSLLAEVIEERVGINLAQCGNVSQKYYIYLDDIIATGGTVFKDLKLFLSNKDATGKEYFKKAIDKEIIVIVSVFCQHNAANILWRLRMDFDEEKILKSISFISDYEIQNSPTAYRPRLNFAYPLDNGSKEVQDYLNTLSHATSKSNIAYRKAGTPLNESLFSSPENRQRFESVILKKGIQLLLSASSLKPFHRPLGATFPSYKTFGTGTLFFTWRNISNTCPVVFWWKVNWLPLFPLYKRGI
jgi:hypothetical protein